MLTCNNVIAQTPETISAQRKEIMVGHEPSDIAVSSVTNKIYVSNAVSGTVTLIDTGATKEIRVGANPRFIAVDDFHNKIYVANRDSNTVSVIDGNNDSKIKEIPVGIDPVSILVGYNSKIYVANAGRDTISVIDASNDTREKHDIAVGRGPRLIVQTFSGAALVANTFSNTVSVINETTNTVQKTITVGTRPGYLYFDNFGGDVYVGNGGSNTVSLINTTDIHDPNFLRVTNIPVGFPPAGIAVGYGKGFVLSKIFVLSRFNDTLSVIDGRNYTLIDVIQLPIGPGRMTSGAGRLWVSNQFSGTVSVINATDGKKEQLNIPVGGFPSYISFNNGMIYVVKTPRTSGGFHFPLGSVSVINAS